MPRPRLAGLAALLVATAWAAGVAPADPPPAGGPPGGRLVESLVEYVGSEAVGVRLHALEGPRARVDRYGTSAHGKPLLVLRVGRADLPQVLVHGGVGDRDAAGTAAALELAERLARAPEKDDPLARVGFLVVPAPNPDALDGFLAGDPRMRGGGDVDRDKDGRAGEDGPDDLDGDGQVLSMRRRSRTGTFVVDDAPAGEGGKRTGDPRLSKDAGVDVRRAVSYEAAVREGRDDDGDGDVNEDPPGQDLTRSFLGVWEDQGAWSGEGPFPAAAPETKALMDLSYDTANLVAWYAFASEGPRIERGGERAKESDQDEATYAALAAAWKAASGVEVRKAHERPGAGANPGCEVDWAVRHLGVFAARVPVWRIDKEPQNARERPDPDELDWLLWNDRVLLGKGFVAWHEVRVPGGEPVEVGGWLPFTRHEPPRDALPAAVRKVAGVPLAHAGFAPRLALTVSTTALGAGLFQVEARAEDVGGGPTETAVAVAAHRSMGVHLRFVPAAGVTTLAGPTNPDLGVLAAGASSERVTWTVRAPAGGRLGVVRGVHRIAGPAEREATAP